MGIYRFFICLLLLLSNKGLSQVLSVSFEAKDTGYRQRLFFIDVNKIGTHNVGSEKYLKYSTDINKNSAVKIPLKPGFYRIQVVPNNLENYSYNARLNNATYIYLTPEVKLKMKFKQQNNLHDYETETTDETNKQLAAFLKKHFDLTDGIKELLIAGRTDVIDSFKTSYIDLYAKALADNQFSAIQLFILNELANFELRMDSKDFAKYIPADYADVLLKKKQKNPLEKEFCNQYLKEKKEVDFSQILKLSYLDNSGILSKLQTGSKNLIIHFWASWCNPCRADNRVELQNLVQGIDTARFDVINISLDEDKQKWQEASAKDNITWKNYLVQASDLTILRKSLKIVALPRIIIFNKGGTVFNTGCNAFELAEIVKGIY